MIVSCSTSKNANGQQSVSKKAQSLFNEGLKFQSYGEYEQAINLFKQSIKKAPKFLNAYDALANTYQKNNQLINSKNTYLKLLSLKSDHFFGIDSLSLELLSERRIHYTTLYNTLNSLNLTLIQIFTS